MRSGPWFSFSKIDARWRCIGQRPRRAAAPTFPAVVLILASVSVASGVRDGAPLLPATPLSANRSVWTGGKARHQSTVHVDAQLLPASPRQQHDKSIAARVPVPAVGADGRMNSSLAPAVIFDRAASPLSAAPFSERSSSPAAINGNSSRLRWASLVNVATELQHHAGKVFKLRSAEPDADKGEKESKTEGESGKDNLDLAGKTCKDEAPIMNGQLLFCGGLYLAGGAGFLASKYDFLTDTNNAHVVFVSKNLKKLSVFLEQRPRFAPVLICFVCFFFADFFAQFTPSYWCGDAHWDWKSTTAVAVTAAALHGGVLRQYLMLIDRHVQPIGGNGPGYMLLRSLATSAAVVLVYVPAAALIFGLVAGLIFRTLADMQDHCILAALADMPNNFGSALSLQVTRFKTTCLASCVFWPPAHVFNYMVIYRWSPYARTSFDSFVCLLWNVFVVITGSPDRRAAVGPLLSGYAPGPEEPGPGLLDCGNWSVGSMLKDLGSILWKVAVALKNGSVIVGTNTGTGIERISKFIAFVLKWIAVTICTILKSSATILRLGLYIPIFLLWKVVSVPFKIFDATKWMYMMSWASSPFPYDSEPYAPIWPFDGNSSSFLCCGNDFDALFAGSNETVGIEAEKDGANDTTSEKSGGSETPAPEGGSETPAPSESPAPEETPAPEAATPAAETTTPAA